MYDSRRASGNHGNTGNQGDVSVMGSEGIQSYQVGTNYVQDSRTPQRGRYGNGNQRQRQGIQRQTGLNRFGNSGTRQPFGRQATSQRPQSQASRQGNGIQGRVNVQSNRPF